MRDGEFDKILLRPVHPLISIIGDSREFVALADFYRIRYNNIYANWTFYTYNIIINYKNHIFSIIGALIIGAINTIFSISSFWTYKSNEVIWSFYRMYTFVEYPIDIYNGFIKILITVILPFAFVAYYPTVGYLGFNNYMLYLSPFIAIVLWIIAVKLWNMALNKYRSTGT